MNASDIVREDTAYMVDNLNEELTELSGNKILLTGGGGFLGYYLVNTIVGWNPKWDLTSAIFDLAEKQLPLS